MNSKARMKKDKNCSSRFSRPLPGGAKIPFGHPTGMRLAQFCAVYGRLLDTKCFILAMPTDEDRAAMYYGGEVGPAALDTATRQAARKMMAEPDHPADLDLHPEGIDFASACWWAATGSNTDLLLVRAEGRKPSEIAESVLDAIVDRHGAEGPPEIDGPQTDTPIPTLSLGWEEAEWLEIMRKAGYPTTQAEFDAMQASRKA